MRAQSLKEEGKKFVCHDLLAPRLPLLIHPGHPGRVYAARIAVLHYFTGATLAQNLRRTAHTVV